VASGGSSVASLQYQALAECFEVVGSKAQRLELVAGIVEVLFPLTEETKESLMGSR
jgi:hypothetical protein